MAWQNWRCGSGTGGAGCGPLRFNRLTRVIRIRIDEGQQFCVMQTYWGNFVKSGNPNSPATVATWTQYNGSTSYQKLAPGAGNQSSCSTFSNEHFCSTWEPVLKLL